MAYPMIRSFYATKRKGIQYKESAAQSSAAVDIMRNVFDQARVPAATDMENKLREIADAYQNFAIEFQILIHSQNFKLLQCDRICEHIGHRWIPCGAHRFRSESCFRWCMGCGSCNSQAIRFQA